MARGGGDIDTIAKHELSIDLDPIHDNGSNAYFNEMTYLLHKVMFSFCCYCII